MSPRLRLLVAFTGLVCVALFAQAGVICHVVDCHLPQPPVCPYHQPTPSVKVCDEVAAVLAELEMDLALPESPVRDFALTFFETVTRAPQLCAISVSPPPSVLRL